MPFDRVVMEFRAICGDKYHLDPQQYDSQLSKEALRMFDFLTVYGARITIVSAYSFINAVDFGTVMEFLDGPPRYVPDANKQAILREMLQKNKAPTYDILYVDSNAKTLRLANFVGVRTCGLVTNKRLHADICGANPSVVAFSLADVTAHVSAQLPQY
jgi:hypothetical protein